MRHYRIISGKMYNQYYSSIVSIRDTSSIRSISYMSSTSVNIERSVAAVHGEDVVTDPWVIERGSAELVEMSGSVLSTHFVISYFYLNLDGIFIYLGK